MNSVLIMSDSHGLTSDIDMIKSRHDVDHVIHCGDSELTAQQPELKGVTIVKGNCDFERAFKEEIVINIKGLKFLIVHGHLHDVRANVYKLSLRAAELNVDVVCYGHTHTVHTEVVNNELIINPGSIWQPRMYDKKTYAILSWTTREDLLVNYYTVTGEKVEELTFNASLNG